MGKNKNHRLVDETVDNSAIKPDMEPLSTERNNPYNASDEEAVLRQWSVDLPRQKTHQRHYPSRKPHPLAQMTDEEAETF